MERPPSTEHDLLAALRRGDEAAFEDVVRRLGPRLLSVARRYLPEEEARDAVQESFVTLFRAVGEFDERSRLATWLHRVVVNHCLMRHRSDRRRPTERLEELLPTFDGGGHRRHPGPAWPPDAELLLLQEERRAFVREAISRLPDTHREVLLLREIEELSGAETAARLGTSTGAVKVRLHRARMALREMIDRQLGGSTP